MTEVPGKTRFGRMILYVLAVGLLPAAAQTPPQQPPAGHPAAALYDQLRSVGLDPNRVYRVRDTSFDRTALHITLDDGTIAFTQDVAGHVTGAFFEGDGEVLLLPPNQIERASMVLFTRAAILEERFVTAYFRFNDDTFSELQSSLRPAENPQEFISTWDRTARIFAEADALRLLVSFSRSLPVAGASAPPAAIPVLDDRFLHARLEGRKLGTFDLYYDSLSSEQVWAGQLKTVEGVSYYDVWTSFALDLKQNRSEDLNGITEEGGKGGPIEISDYAIRAEVKPPTQMKVDVTLRLLSKQAGWRAVLFELSRFLQIESVDEDGLPLEFIHNPALEGTQRARRGNDLVAVIFAQPLQAGQRMRLHFVYGGDVLSEAGSGLLYVGARGNWYPSVGLAMSSFDLEFHYPPGWTLVATGKRMEASGGGPPSPGGDQVSRWVSDRPIPFAGFNLGKYVRAVAHSGDATVESYATSGVERTFPKGEVEAVMPPFPTSPGIPQRPLVITTPPPSPARNAQPVADESARAIDFYSPRFGPYPYSKLALTQMPGPLSQGWPSLIFLSSFSFLTPAEQAALHMDPVEAVLGHNVIAHETAHQWWGDLVLWSSYRDQWIVEALANYSALMLLESEDPGQFHAVMERFRDDLLQKNKQDVPLMDAGPVTFGSRLNCSQFPNGYQAISYGRGTWLFHMLRYMMRDAEPEKPGADEPFVRALRKLREQYQGKSVSTRDLLRVFDAELPPSLWYEGHKSLDWFYEGWVDGVAVPRLELQGVKVTRKAGATVASGTILQKDSPKDLVTSVPVYAVLPTRSVLLGRVFADGPETVFHLPAPEGTRKVVLDPNHTVLSRAK